VLSATAGSASPLRINAFEQSKFGTQDLTFFFEPQLKRDVRGTKVTAFRCSGPFGETLQNGPLDG
jgi:hypothetical protein